MDKTKVKEIIGKYGVLPVINITEKETAIPLVDSLTAGGLPLIEVTLRSESSLESIKAIKKARPGMLVGAGTVLTTENVDAAIDAGANFIVSPGYDPELVRYCNKLGVAMTPGCSTASEIQDAVKNGVEIVKFFPAEQSGGLKTIKLLSGPFPGVKFLPTGGITLDNLGGYLSCDKVIACGGSFMANSAMIAAGDFDGITKNCERAVRESLGFRLAHIGINGKSREDSLGTAKLIASLFGFPIRECSASVFAGEIAECMDSPRGTNGHISISTRSLVRAMEYLSAKGVEFDTETFKYDKAGNVTCAYFREEIAGFAWHIVKGE